VIWNLSINDAMDLIDIYGADEDLWPRQDADALKNLVATDEDFADYVADVKRIDDLLANWEEAEDGLDVGEKDDKNPWGDQDDEDESDDLNYKQGGGAGNDEEIPDQQDEDENETVIEINPERLEDMDKMFSDAIQKAFSNADPTEFRVFTRDYDELVDIEGVNDQTSIAEIDTAVAKSTGPLMKDLRRMIAARSQVQRIPGMRRGRLHGPNLHRILSGDDRVFTRKEEAQSLDTAISLVVDCSGSMAGDRMKLAMETAYSLGSVLSRLGIQFECLGFTDNYSDPRVTNKSYKKEAEAADAVAKIIRAVPITMPRFKEFSERWNQPVQRRFAQVFNADGGYGCGVRFGSTPEGCGMEFAARRLLRRKEARKIMIVMTDGEPGGHVFNPQSMNDHWAYKRQSAEMVKAIEAAGVDLVGIGIQHAGPTGYYTNSMVIQSLDEMPKQLLQLLKKFIVGK
jgi:cobalamin biosynthesis protein CobT